MPEVICVVSFWIYEHNNAICDDAFWLPLVGTTVPFVTVIFYHHPCLAMPNLPQLTYQRRFFVSIMLFLTALRRSVKQEDYP